MSLVRTAQLSSDIQTLIPEENRITLCHQLKDQQSQSDLGNLLKSASPMKHPIMPKEASSC
jgi:hypothetical protein